jgi:hypothetical protein
MFVLVKSGLESRNYGRRGIRRTDHATPLYPQKLALTSPTIGGRSVGIVCSRTKATELVSYCLRRIVYERLQGRTYEY